MQFNPTFLKLGNFKTWGPQFFVAFPVFAVAFAVGAIVNELGFFPPLRLQDFCTVLFVVLLCKDLSGLVGFDVLAFSLF